MDFTLEAGYVVPELCAMYLISVFLGEVFDFEMCFFCVYVSLIRRRRVLLLLGLSLQVSHVVF